MLSSLLSRLTNNMLLSQAMLIPIEASVNQILLRDPAALKTIAAESGRLVCIEIEDMNLVYIRLLDHGVSVSLINEAQPDVIMRGTLADYAALANAENKSNQLINSNIDMDGDTELSITLTKLMQKLDIDWEALIEPLTGSLLAHQIGKGVRGLMKWGKTTGATYTTATKDYLEDEVQLVTPEPLLTEFFDQVDELRLATDRLQARMNNLITRTQNTNTDLS